ncbi:MAG: NAD+ synthase [Candidatus Tenebribacter mawsonii]|nr:NAD+ synthase [Candidatus Tenebribacter mawsonii]
MREIDLTKQIDLITKFIKEQLSLAGFDRLIVGLSGGIDSSVTAALCVRAIGSENVHGVMLPYRKSHPDSLGNGIEIANLLKIKYEVKDISPMIDTYFEKYEQDADILRKGNRMARERMCVLYDLSAKYKALVAGTGNLSELMIGYCTQYGDSACAFEPIGHLYKSEVYTIAEKLGLSQNVITKKPTADLWEGQTDEEEMGITYVELDEILYQILDKKKTDSELKILFNKEKIDKVKKMIKMSEFKRNIPPVPVVFQGEQN